MKTNSLEQESQLAACVAPEDLHVGDYVAYLYEIHEVPSFLWQCDSTALSPNEPVRIRCTARDHGGPYRIVAVCLPFVLLKQPDGQSRTIDVRLVQLARLNKAYAKKTLKALKKTHKKNPLSALFQM